MTRSRTLLFVLAAVTLVAAVFALATGNPTARLASLALVLVGGALATIAGSRTRRNGQ